MTRLETRPQRSRPIRPRPPRSLTLPTLLLVLAGTSLLFAPVGARPADEPAGPFAQAAATLADSIEARLSLTGVRVLEANGDAIRISLGSRGGVRNWSRIVLLGPDSAPWIGEVRDIEESTTWLGPSANPASPVPGTPAPAVGATVRARLAGVRLGLRWPADGPDRLGRITGEFLEELSVVLHERHGWIVRPIAAGVDRAGERRTATGAGLDFVVGPRLAAGTSGIAIASELFAARRDDPMADIVLPPILDAALLEAASDSADSPRRPLPGTHHAWIDAGHPGPLLDLFVRRWIWSDVFAVFDDRIEQWTLSPTGRRATGRHDLLADWPPAVGARWPQATVIPVNTWYDEEGEEAKVNYSLCSTSRPRYLTLNIDRADPESLWIAVGDGPLDTLAAAIESCFPRLDRVARPEGFVIPKEMPADARARLNLEEVVVGPSGVPTRGEAGRLLMRKVAVVYYDEASASLWLSTPTGGSRVPGVFGAEFDTYRLGETGRPGLLVTAGVDPGEPDRIIHLEFDGESLVRRWVGPLQPGSITALDAADRDGDGQEDVLYGVVRAGSAGWTTDVHYLSSSSAGPEVTP